MSEKLRESLSATIDDEADEFELRRVLDEMEKDGQLRETWERYHLIGTIMRGERTCLGAQVRDKVWAALDLENLESLPDALAPPTVANAGNPSGAPRLGRLVGIGVAATVAFAVAFGISSIDFEDQTAPEVAASEPSVEVPQAANVQLRQEVSATDLQRANAYMMHHVQHQALNQPGVTSFVKMVTYERQ